MGSEPFGPIGFQQGHTFNLDNRVLQYIINHFGVKTMIDVGCGFGKQVEVAKELGIQAYGVDGDPSLKIFDQQTFFRHDYTQGKFNNHPLPIYDLGWSMEFVEHVYEKYLGNVLATFKKCKLLMVTHAIPGQNGTHHVNLKEDDYWIDRIVRCGFTYDPQRTLWLRNKAESVYTVRGGLFFVNTSLLMGIKK